MNEAFKRETRTSSACLNVRDGSLSLSFSLAGAKLLLSPAGEYYKANIIFGSATFFATLCSARLFEQIPAFYRRAGAILLKGIRDKLKEGNNGGN